MTGADLAGLLVPGRVLTADDVAVLAAALEPPWRTRQRGRKARAAAIAAALAATGAPGRYGACCALARALATRAQGRRPGGDDLCEAVDRVLELNGGQPLGWRQLLREQEAMPGEFTVTKTGGDDSAAGGATSP